MSAKTTKNGGLSRGKRKYPDEHGYKADMGKGLYDPEVSSDLTFDTLRRYNNRHASLLKDDLTSACYAVMTPKGELIEIMKQVDQEAPTLKPNAFHPNDTPLQLEGSRYGRLVVD